ncbi:unnamed protein product [marine sediment metagenome]|uniref:Uncharacterized protein n=1 Tax=marine sediment metagenome TaxID=412755 RepID=X1B2N0_9ZZZZ
MFEVEYKLVVALSFTATADFYVDDLYECKARIEKMFSSITEKPRCILGHFSNSVYTVYADAEFVGLVRITELKTEGDKNDLLNS